MANTINIPKTHLIMGLSLPLAVLLGYFVAEPMELGSMAVVVFVLVVLTIPLMMKWYYPLLVLSWNGAMAPAFLPGQPNMWAIMAVIGLLFAVGQRAITANARFVNEPSIIKPLLALTGVVVVTGLLTNGIGFHMLGSSLYGGKKYFYFLAAVMGYFVFTSRRIPPHRAGFYVALFFLAGLTHIATILAGLGNAKVNFLWILFPPSASLREPALGGLTPDSGTMLRVDELASIGMTVCMYLMARFGIRGLLDLTRPWRLLLLSAALVAAFLSGFRSCVLFAACLFAVLFYLEGLHRTRYAPALLGLMLLGSAVVLPQADKLPLVVQRALSFLPGKFDYTAQASAIASTEWRIEMWKQLLPEVPKSLFTPRGWGIAARDFRTSVELVDRSDQLAGVKLVGNFHNGALSVLIPFGLYGAVAFVWFLVAGLRVLHRNWKLGDPALHRVNALLLAAFITQVIIFFGIYGALETDVAVFAGLLGLSVALNGADVSPVPAEQPVTGVELSTEYIRV